MSRARSFSKLINKDNYATYSGSDSVTDISAVSLPQGTLNFRNKIINGDMRIDQRNDGASVTPTSAIYTLDRWLTNNTEPSKFSVQQNAGSVAPPIGFTNYLGVTSLSAYSVLSTDFFSILQSIEGFNVADLGFGSTNAKEFTLSFLVRSSLTGTFGGSFNNYNFSRSYPFSYTINSANTWEQKTITITGDTTGTWLTNNGKGIQIYFNLGSGSNYSGTSGGWTSGTYLAPTGAVSVVGTNGATFYITGVQLEEGTVPTPFEHRPYGVELSLCQRYYIQIGESGNVGDPIPWVGYAETSTLCKGGLPLPVELRANPSGSLTGTPQIKSSSGNYNITGINRVAKLSNGCVLDVDTDSHSISSSSNIRWRQNEGILVLDAEL